MPHGTLSYALEAVHVRLKSVSNEVHFTLKAERVFRPYLPLHCTGFYRTCDMALPSHTIEAMQVRWKSVSNGEICRTKRM
jgi:hypothetical protein